ncbi:MAG: WbqC family protein [Bacteroidota bacterium]
MLFPTAYFPSINYLKSLCQCKKVHIDQHEHWIKQSIRNRCEILGAEGLQKLIVPICHEPGKQSLGSIRVDDAKRWRANHWKSIKTAYGRSPYFEHYQREIEACIFNDEQRLVALNEASLNLFINAWELPIETKKSLEFTPYSQNDQRLKDWLTRAETHVKYQQVFQPKSTLIFNPSALDLLCCEGPLGRKLLIN